MTNDERQMREAIERARSLLERNTYRAMQEAREVLERAMAEFQEEASRGARPMSQ